MAIETDAIRPLFTLENAEKMRKYSNGAVRQTLHTGFLSFYTVRNSGLFLVLLHHMAG